jgi:hypothetical protein
MKRGRPFEPGNHFGRGRPKGSRNKRSQLAKQLLDEHGEAIVRKSLVIALQGDPTMLRTLLSFILARPKDLPFRTGHLAMGTAEEIAIAYDATLRKAESGQITPSQAQQIFNLLEERRRFIETQELAQRVSALEQSDRENSPEIIR